MAWDQWTEGIVFKNLIGSTMAFLWPDLLTPHIGTYRHTCTHHYYHPVYAHSSSFQNTISGLSYSNRAQHGSTSLDLEVSPPFSGLLINGAHPGLACFFHVLPISLLKWSMQPFVQPLLDAALLLTCGLNLRRLYFNFIWIKVCHILWIKLLLTSVYIHF